MARSGQLFVQLVVAVLVTGQTSGAHSKCPSSVNSWCLMIDGDETVVLDGNVFREVRGALQYISNFLTTLVVAESKSFDQFFMFNNHEVRRLEANTFADLRFRKIKIKNCTQLIRIDPLAFNGTQDLVEKVTIDLISITGPQNIDDFFEALNNLHALQELTLLNHNVITVPPFAFRQPALHTLELDVINNNAFFDLDALKILRLFRSVKHVPKHAFDFKSARNKTLDVYLDITWNTLEAGVFEHVLRPVNLNLYLKKLRDFPQKVFEPILMADMRHDIVFHGEIKEMRDKCVLVWLFRAKPRFLGSFSFKVMPSLSGEQIRDNCEQNQIDGVNDSQVNASSGVNLNLGPINSMDRTLIDQTLLLVALLALNLLQAN